MSNSGRMEMEMPAARAYIHDVKERFRNDPEIVKEFLKILTCFRNGRLGVADVKTRLEELFRGHQDLILRLDEFLARGSPERQPPAEYRQAVAFVDKIKTRFQDEESRYVAFLDIMNSYRKERTSISSVYHAVARLFHDNHDLVEEFISFLPDEEAKKLNESLLSEGHENKGEDKD